MANKDREAVRQGMGDVLGPSSDLLAEVLEGDRKRTGRAGAVERPVAQLNSTEDQSSSVVDTTSNHATGATDSEVGSNTTGVNQEATQSLSETLGPADRRKQSERIAPPAPVTDQAPDNPLEIALREMLANPYSSDPGKGPFTVTSMKLQTEVSERLGWASTLLKRPKQEIVSEALRLYFERILQEG